LKGKRGLLEEVENLSPYEDVTVLKKSRKNGGVVIHESVLVEAVEQPRWSQ
jgi:hypothetical protein